MGNILVDLIAGTFTLLGTEHVPKEEEPVEEEAALRDGHGNLRVREVIWSFLVHLVLGVGIHGVITEGVPNQLTVLVAAAVLLDLDLRVAVEDCAGAVVHVVAEEVLVDIRVKQGAIVVVGRELSRGAMGTGWRDRRAITGHHWHRGADRPADRAYVGHSNVIHRL